jgi:hypothetical protein
MDGLERILSVAWESRAMNEQTLIDREALVCEIDRYLAAVDLYRAEHCEPTWQSEPAPRRTVQKSAPTRAEHAPSAH